MRGLPVVLALALVSVVPVTCRSEASDGAALCNIYSQQSTVVKDSLTSAVALFVMFVRPPSSWQNVFVILCTTPEHGGRCVRKTCSLLILLSSRRRPSI